MAAQHFTDGTRIPQGAHVNLMSVSNEGHVVFINPNVPGQLFHFDLEQGNPPFTRHPQKIRLNSASRLYEITRFGTGERKFDRPEVVFNAKLNSYGAPKYPEFFNYIFTAWIGFLIWCFFL